MKLNKRRRGMALLLVSMVIVLVALAAYGYLYHMQSQYRLARVQLEQTEARQAALSGIEKCLALVDKPGDLRVSAGSLENNEEQFGNQLLNTSPSNNSDEVVWRFSILSPPTISGDSTMVDDRSNYRYGLENESAKIHIPTLLQWDRLQPGQANKSLMNLPGASSELVTLFLEYCRSPNQQPKQAITPDRIAWLWNGGDWNQNYRIDPIESQLNSFRSETNRNSRAAASVATENSTIAGWQQYLTWDNGQRNENWNGQRRIYLNESNLQKLHAELLDLWPEPWANFVILYRQYGGVPRSAATKTTSTASIPVPDFQKGATTTLRSSLDLIDMVVRIPSNSGPPTLILSPFLSESLQQGDYFGRIIDEVTVSPDEYLVGLIDVNEAPVEVLMAVPGMTQSLAQRCVQSRQGAQSPSDRRHVGWLVSQGLCDLPTFKKLYPYLCARSDVFRIQVLGYRDDLSPTYRATVVLDGRVRPAQARNFQHWQNWGRF